MIYLDCAATSLQKPASVHRAAAKALRSFSSPGRGAYASAMAAADVLYDCRAAVAELFYVPEPERVVFTMNATHGLNIALKSLVRPGDRVVVSGYEHNAVMRPLHALGADVRVAASPLWRPEAAVEAFRRALPGAKAAVCCHVSNVFGYILPLAEIAALCREAGVPLVVDASQSAGTLPLAPDALGCAYTAMPGHKGLLGPQGTGVLICGRGAAPRPLLEGGTGSESERADMPELLPERLEAGTHDMPGIAGLLAGVRYVHDHTPEALLAHERRMLALFCDGLAGARGLRLYRASDGRMQTGVLSVQVDGLDCEEAARLLGERKIAVRAGLHCAPLAHRTAGTLRRGAVRMSFSPFTTEWEVRAAAAALRDIARGTA